MNNATELAKNAIDRARNMKQFTVMRNENNMVLHGVIRYDVNHHAGQPYRITVPAISQNEAEQFADDWIAEMRAAG
jgi:hypothetical protein